MTQRNTKSAWRTERLAGVALVLVLHAAALWGLLSHRLVVLPMATPSLLVELIAPTPSPSPQPAPAAAAPKVPVVEPLRQAPGPTIANAAIADEMPTAITAPAQPKLAVPPAPTPALPAGPVALNGELALSCPERSAPDYPLASRRRNETGTTMLHVELDPTGQIAAASILESSGSPRLDEAALAAVRRWRCAPPLRDGHAVRATARQAFKFVLQGS